MNLVERINEDMKLAMKSLDKEKLEQPSKNSTIISAFIFKTVGL